MFKSIEAAALAAVNRLAAPWIEEIHRLQAENKALAERVTALEGRFEEESRQKVPSAEEVANLIKGKALSRAMENVDWKDVLSDEFQEWASVQDWNEEFKKALDSGDVLDEDSIQAHIGQWLGSEAGVDVVRGAIYLHLSGRTIEIVLK